MDNRPCSSGSPAAGRTGLEHATAAHELKEQTQHEHSRGYVARVKALLETDLGLVDEARASAEESLAFARASSNTFFTICLRSARSDGSSSSSAT